MKVSSICLLLPTNLKVAVVVSQSLVFALHNDLTFHFFGGGGGGGGGGVGWGGNITHEFT